MSPKDAVKDAVSVKKVKKALMGRVHIVGLAIFIQLAWIYLLVWQVGLYVSYVDTILRIAGIGVCLYIIGQWKNPAYKIVWTFVILTFPIMGLIIYVIFGRSRITSKTREKLEASHREVSQLLQRNKDLEQEISRESKRAAQQSGYMTEWSDFPVYKNTQTKYYPCGEVMFPDMLDDLRSAKHFIFLEYFIIAEGHMFDQILEILKERVKEGVDVRMTYDDFGSVTTIPSKFYLEMEVLGIRCVAFNRLRPSLSVIMNNRDHRKILVIDGKVGYTGGLNLADEYINEKERFGYWKDTGVRLEGDAVWSFTLMFLEMWNYTTGDTEQYESYMPKVYQEQPFVSDGYVQPYEDSPLDQEKVGENVYLNIINHANDYVYIFTPYLILDNEMLTVLRLAAKSGVDVRIVLPEIPDKLLVFWMSQSYYHRLLESGVRIYQYTPGFIHAKSFVCDDIVATVGSINMDFRSLYLHFENGVWFYRSSVVLDVKQDALEVFSQSRELSLEWYKKQSLPRRMIFSTLRLFAPLL